jgi:hypothetical protein
MENELEIQNNQAKQHELFELGQWMGRKQAFSLVAGKTAAADVECLRSIRDSKLYRAKDLDWAGFCKEHVGVTKAYANRLIRHLEKFGPNYFHLSQVMRISADTYSQIAPAVSDAGITFRGETIAISPENSGKIVAAVSALCARVPAKQRVRAIAAALKRLDACLAELNRIRDGELNKADREDLAGAVDDGVRDLTLLSISLRIRA